MGTFSVYIFFMHKTIFMSNEITTRYSDEDLKFFDDLVSKKLTEAKEQLEYYLQQIEEYNESEDSRLRSIEDSNSNIELDNLHNMATRQRKLIQHLDNAKSRIKNKVYGICRETGKLISKERLIAVPHATLSIEAKQG